MDDTGITLVLGGASSGKSEVAEGIAAAVGEPVTYVATGREPDDLDVSWADRVAAHRRRRPPQWSTMEVAQGADLGRVLRELPGAALVDSLGAWVAGLPGFGQAGAAVPLADALVEALRERRDLGNPTVLVSDEVGLGVHPSTALGGSFRDALGHLNRLVATVADPVLLVVAGRLLPLARPPVAPGVQGWPADRAGHSWP